MSDVLDMVIANAAGAYEASEILAEEGNTITAAWQQRGATHELSFVWYEHELEEPALLAVKADRLDATVRKRMEMIEEEAA